MASEVFKPSSSLERFSTVRNTTASRLEEVLGISFGGSFPSEVILDPKNKLQFFREHPINSTISGLGNTAAFYDSEYDACFVYPECVDEETLFHENLHGWLARLNPEFALSDKEIIQASRKDPERTIVNLVCGEGLADLGTVQALRNQIKIDKATALEWELLGGVAWESAEDTYQRKAMKHAFAAIEEGTMQLSKIHFRRGLIRSIRELAIQLKIEGYFYPAGFFFTKFAADTLMRSGMKFADAYKLLAQHMPTTIDELKHPEAFAQKLLHEVATASL